MAIKLWHKDYDIVDGKLTKPFSLNNGTSRSDVICSFSLDFSDEKAYFKPYNLKVTFVFFAKSGPHHERFRLMSSGNTAHECFTKLRRELEHLRFVAGLNLAATKP